MHRCTARCRSCAFSDASQTYRCCRWEGCCNLGPLLGAGSALPWAEALRTDQATPTANPDHTPVQAPPTGPGLAYPQPRPHPLAQATPIIMPSHFLAQAQLTRSPAHSLSSSAQGPNNTRPRPDHRLGSGPSHSQPRLGLHPSPVSPSLSFGTASAHPPALGHLAPRGRVIFFVADTLLLLKAL